MKRARGLIAVVLAIIATLTSAQTARATSVPRPDEVRMRPGWRSDEEVATRAARRGSFIESS